MYVCACVSYVGAYVRLSAVPVPLASGDPH